MTLHLSNLLLALPALCAAGGVGLLSHAGLGLAGDIVTGLRHRWGRRVRIGFVADEGATVTLDQRRVTLSWPLLLPVAGGLVLVGLWHHPVLSTWTALLGGIGTALGYYSQPRKTAEDRTLQELFLSALRSRYGITQSLRCTLQGVAEDLDAPDTSLGQALAKALRLLNAGEPVREAVKPLATQGEIMRRLTTILEHTHRTAREETEQLLEELEEQARQARRLAERAQVTLVVTRATLRVLTVANVTAMAAVALLPLWRQHYRQQPAAYLVSTGLAFAGVCYFRFKIKDLEENL
jgi:hypothetical protein